MAGQPECVIHGDLNPSNVLIDANEHAAILDWDESRLDVAAFDQAALCPPAAGPALNALRAWEIACCWQIEPDHARNLARNFERERTAG
jgi:Ser/Thr protein kinase RdoA (MazF antagonist)